MLFYPAVHSHKCRDSYLSDTLKYCEFPFEHWTRVRANNVIERLNQETRRG